ncbi:MAG: hypothetical protein ACFFCS_17145 [Candidatus Hodarchaeota archaeon]
MTIKQDDGIYSVTISLKPLDVLKEKVSRTEISSVLKRAAELMEDNSKALGWKIHSSTFLEDELKFTWKLRQRGLLNVPMYHIELELAKTRKLIRTVRTDFLVEQDGRYAMYLEKKAICKILFKAFLINAIYKDRMAFSTLEDVVLKRKELNIGTIKRIFCFRGDKLEREKTGILMEINIHEEENIPGERNILEREELVPAFSEDHLGPEICHVILFWDRKFFGSYEFSRDFFLILLKNTLYPESIFLTKIEAREGKFKRILTESEKTREQIKKEFRGTFFDLTFEYFMLKGNLEHVEDDMYDWVD